MTQVEYAKYVLKSFVGLSCDEIHKKLKRAKIKGIPLESHGCPIATYLTKKKVKGVGVGGVYGKGWAIIDRGTINANYVKLPASVTRFISSVDKNCEKYADILK